MSRHRVEPGLRWILVVPDASAGLGSWPVPGPQWDGVVAVGRPVDGHEWLERLRRVLRAVPADVAGLVYVDDLSMSQVAAVVPDMLQRLAHGDAAVAAAVPVTDALKRVDDARVSGSVDRHGLFVLRPPLVVRRAALESLLAARDASGDLAELLLGAGLAVRMVRVDGTSAGGRLG